MKSKVNKPFLESYVRCRRVTPFLTSVRATLGGFIQIAEHLERIIAIRMIRCIGRSPLSTDTPKRSAQSSR